jgi:hypothetical protein
VHGGRGASALEMPNCASDIDIRAIEETLMTDNHATTADSPEPQPNAQETRTRAPFPGVRLAYAAGFAVVAWVVFWVSLLLGLAQWIITAIGGDQDDQLKRWSRNLNQYLWEVLSFIVFARDDKPFPFGTPFPKM